MAINGDQPEHPAETFISGRVTTLRRRGQRVWRPHAHGSSAVIELLQHLELRGFEGAPRLLASEVDDGMEVSWLDGWVPDESETWKLDDPTIGSVGALLREYHECVCDFAPSSGFEEGPQTRTTGAIVCHGDIAPRNTVFRDGMATAFIDWDGIWIADPLWDLAHAVWQFAPICGDDDPWLSDCPDPPDRFARTRALVRGYALERHRASDFGQRIVDVIAGCQLSVERKAADGQPAFEAMVREGMLDTLDRRRRAAEAMKHELTTAATETS